FWVRLPRKLGMTVETTTSVAGVRISFLPIMIFAVVVFCAIIDGWASFHATGDGAWYSVALVESSLLFLLMGGFLCLVEKKEDGDAKSTAAPPKTLVGAAVIAELAKSYLLLQLPPPHSTSSDAQSFNLALWS